MPISTFRKKFGVIFLSLIALMLSTSCDASSPDINKVENSPTSKAQLTVLLYHHIDDSTPASTSTSPKMFAQHLDYLEQNNFTVLDLESALTALFSGEPLPAKAVAISFDDGYESIYRTAWPMLKDKGFPFTVFLSTSPIDKGFGSMMTWQQVKEMHKSGVVMANHTLDHPHLLELPFDEFKQQVDQTDQVLKQQLGTASTMFAYPYGEYSSQLANYLESTNRFGLAQVSGPISAMSNPQALPRFSMSGRFASMQQFELKVNAHAMAIKHQQNWNPVVSETQNSIELLFADSVGYGNRINCFFENQSIQNTSWQSNRLTISDYGRLKEGRNRINCTAPSQVKGEFYWYSIPLFLTPRDNKWPD